MTTTLGSRNAAKVARQENRDAAKVIEMRSKFVHDFIFRQYGRFVEKPIGYGRLLTRKAGE